MNRDSRYSGRAEFVIDGPRSRPLASRPTVGSDGLSSSGSSKPAGDALSALRARIATNYYRIDPRDSPIDILASEIRPLGTVVFVFTPECDAPTVAR